jgi:hypothetical protein
MAGESKPGPRSLHPAICLSLSLAECEPLAQLLFDRLIVQADDQGRLQGDPRQVQAKCMPLVAEATPEAVSGWIDQLSEHRMVIRYRSDDRDLLQLVNWWTFQDAMRRARPSRWPAPADWTDRTYDIGGKGAVPVLPQVAAAFAWGRSSEGARAPTEPPVTTQVMVSNEQLDEISAVLFGVAHLELPRDLWSALPPGFSNMQWRGAIHDVMQLDYVKKDPYDIIEHVISHLRALPSGPPPATSMPPHDAW